MSRQQVNPENISQISFESNFNFQLKNKLSKPQIHSQHFSESQDKKQQLIMLIITVRLQQMGFRITIYRQFVKDRIQVHKDIQLSQVSQFVNQIVEQILNPSFNIENYELLTKRNRKMSIISRSNDIQSEYDRREYKKTSNNFMKVQQYNVINLSKEQQPKQIKKIPIVCPICCYSTTKYQQYNCHHYFCDQCMRNVIIQDMENGRYDQLCPEYQCNDIIEEQVVKQLLGGNLYSKYTYFRDKALLENDPTNVFCSTPDCGQVLKLQNKILICKKCLTKFCKNCQEKVHQGQCDIALLIALQKLYSKYKIKKCPQCKSPIQKIDGCNHMKCKKCQHDFCWLCLQKCTPHHYRYYNCFGCPGMQFQQQEELLCERIKQIIFIVLIPALAIIILLCVGLLLPIYMVGCIFVKPCEWTSQPYTKKCESYIINEYLCCCLPSCLRNFFTFFVFLPRAILYAIFIAPIRFVIYMINKICGAFI